jgi:sorting nexin-1/2
VNVVNPEVRGTNKYVVYTLKGEDKNGNSILNIGSFETTRRYSDFDQIKNVMLVRWPGCYIPSLPSKKVMGNMDAQFVEERRMGLEEFLIILSKMKHLWYCDAAQALIRSQAPDLEKAVAHLAKPTNADIIQRYEQAFKNLSGK